MFTVLVPSTRSCFATQATSAMRPRSCRSASWAAMLLASCALLLEPQRASASDDAFVILVDGEPIAETDPEAPAGADGSVRAAAEAAVPAPASSTPPGASQIVAGEASLVGPAVPRPRGKAAPRSTTAPAERGALDAVRIDVTFDGAAPERTLGLTIEDGPGPDGSIEAGTPVTIAAHANYPAFVERAELRIHCGNEPRPCAILPLSPNERTVWRAEGDGPYALVYRAYGARNRIDETEPLPLAAPGRGAETLVLARRDIAVRGGTVTVRGRDLPAGREVTALGESVVPNADGTFVMARIVPPGEHEVDVRVASPEGTLDFSRGVHVPGGRWFYVGLADLTVHRALRGPGFRRVSDGADERTHARGRLAFYLKGHVRGDVLITAAADTGEGELRSLFRDLDARHARDLLRRLDPDEYYPVYGDDSTLVEDAPTSGKFYVRVERGDSHVMWGNARTKLSGTKLLARERTIYGASAELATKGATSHGERKGRLTAYAAVPDTLPRRDAMRGTGGSSYFLSRGEVVRGSENLVIELRDRRGGRVLERRDLVYGEDYEIDYDEGVVILRRPLSSTATDGRLVRDGGLGGYEVWLVAAYEYVPRGREADGHAYGGRGEGWLGDRVRVGVTGSLERDGLDGAGERTDAYGVDILVRRSEGTWARAEIARSRGRPVGPLTSLDGGLTFSSGTRVPAGGRADAVSIEGHLDMNEVRKEFEGAARAWYERREAGFASFGRALDTDERSMGAVVDTKVGERWTLRTGIDEIARADGHLVRDVDAHVGVALTETVHVELGGRHTALRDPALGRDGTRTDAAARVTYQFEGGHRAYLFGQATVDRAGTIARNDRVGVGGTARLSETLGLTGEVSYGTGGIGALGGVTYDPSPDHHSYLTYSIDETLERGLDGGRDWGGDLGTLAAGTRRKLGEGVTLNAGNTFDLFDEAWTLAQSYGITARLDEFWTLGGAFEAGTIRDRTRDPATDAEREDFERRALSASVGFDDPGRGIAARARAEGRRERSALGTRDRDSALVGIDLGIAASDDWRVLGNLDVVLTTGGDPRTDGDYVEGSIGAAWRPVLDPRFEALGRYTYLSDLTGLERVEDLQPMQRSHIVSVDGLWRATPRVELGAKLGARLAESRLRAGADEPTTGIDPTDGWSRNNAMLLAARADVHVVHKWDAFAEARAMRVWTEGEDSTLLGGVIGVSRHLGRNLKVGVGYNFGRFSDDLRDLTLDDEGIFLTVTGKL